MAKKKVKKTPAEIAAIKAALKAETKSAKFTRLASARVSKSIKAIYNIGNLGGSGYESTVEQRTKIESALTDAVSSAMNRLNKETAKPTGFTL